MSLPTWQFFVDVGGTFTDVVARRPDGTIRTHKIPSSGFVRGAVEAGSTAACVTDSRRMGDPDGFWVGFELVLLDPDLSGRNCQDAPPRVVKFDPRTGQLFLDKEISDLESATLRSQQRSYELRGREQAPVLAIRYLMGLGPDDQVGNVDVRLGTTRATNALLERKGADVVFVTTRGFADVLKIGYQDRPALFDLNIRKRQELAAGVVEIDERISADGTVLKALDSGRTRAQLGELRTSHNEDVALAICLLHSHVNPAHEELIATLADELGFRHVSVSSRVSRMERIVPRGDTTVADAYLAPVIRDYVDSLRLAMPEAHLSLMTSSGGLVSAESASGKDTILSGPAGGVVGCAFAARQAGFAKAIAFDMGGTSTDVSRIDTSTNDFERQYETTKAGVRLMTPMLAIETVAAGGGSICAFDGQKLTVGPRSAGAEPGPASYGRGGPLTITDMNLILGRLSEEQFPFRLDRNVVENKVARLAATIKSDTGTVMSPVELAAGFVTIANEKMAAAIKSISIAKGYALRDYVLSSFGGAGGQHACAIARLLGMSQIHINPFAGILSAFGIGVAEVRRIEQRSVRILLDEAARSDVESLFDSLAVQARKSLLAEGVAPHAIADPVRTLDLCYQGQSTLITVPAKASHESRRCFEESHRQLYGYCHTGRAVVIRTLRVELSVPSNHRMIESGLVAAASPVKDVQRTASMIVGGEPRRVPVYKRAELISGQIISGPALVIEDTSTIVIDENWSGEIRATGDIVLTDRGSESDCEEVSAEVDPIRLELFNNKFAAVAEQMGTTLRRTALSTNIKERLDFSCAVFNAQGALVANAPHIPVHLGAMSDCVSALIEDVKRFSPGDVFITNDPYRGGSHLNDVTVITPVHDDSGTSILFYVASRAHHAEIGGTRPGSMPPDSTSLSEEGVLIRAFRWIHDGKSNDAELLNLLTRAPYPSRAPAENLADIHAQTAANQTGVRDLTEMISRFGVEVVHGYMGHIQAAAGRKAQKAMAKLPAGEHRFEDCLDDGAPIRLALSISDGRARFDFSGTAPVLAGNLNANPSIVSSAIIYSLRCLIDEDIPLNAGVLAPVEIVLPECCLNPRGSTDPRSCPAVAGGNVETSQRIVDCILGALQLVAASQGTMNNLLIGDETFGYYETICGGAGAGPGYHGAHAVHTHMTNTRLTDAEVLEARYPLRLIRFEIRKGSGGAGRYRGGDGVIREIEFLGPLEVSLLTQRRTTAPYGLLGGGPGRMGRNLLFRKSTGRTEQLGPIARVSVEKGDRLTVETPGGGGYESSS